MRSVSLIVYQEGAINGQHHHFRDRCNRACAGGFWGMPMEDGVRWIAANPGTWTMSAILLAINLIMCVSGWRS